MSVNLGTVLVTLILILLAWFLWQEIKINRSNA